MSLEQLDTELNVAEEKDEPAHFRVYEEYRKQINKIVNEKIIYEKNKV